MDTNSLTDPFCHPLAHLLLIYLVALGVIVCIVDAAHSRQVTEIQDSKVDSSAKSDLNNLLLAGCYPTRAVKTQGGYPLNHPDETRSSGTPSCSAKEERQVGKNPPHSRGTLARVARES
jgi:hypothetical protein